LEARPFLALLLAERRRFGIREPVQDLAHAKRRDLLMMCGFPTRQGFAPLLARLPRDVLTSRVLLDLLAMGDDELLSTALTIKFLHDIATSLTIDVIRAILVVTKKRRSRNLQAPIFGIASRE
jgi:hypothetical protein